jgi:hypothetical protein
MVCRGCGLPHLQVRCLLFSEIVYEFKETRDGLEQKIMNKIVLKPQETLQLCAIAKSHMRLLRNLSNVPSLASCNHPVLSYSRAMTHFLQMDLVAPMSR